ncbi:MAG: hypothetical protein ACRERS_08880, partial [Methylococcales bacterium]
GEFSQYFIGHTPHYASRLGIFPYLGERVDADSEPVGRVFLIRISDGDYNGQPNPEERLAIMDLINNANNDENNGRKKQHKKLIETKGLDEYNNISNRSDPYSTNLNNYRTAPSFTGLPARTL